MIDIELLVRKARDDGQRTVDQLFTALYPDIRQAVKGLMVCTRPDQPLQATELVNEAYLRLRQFRGADWKDRDHFVRTVARAVRRALVDEVRSNNAAKRGGGLRRTTLGTVAVETSVSAEDLIALDQALERLRQGRQALRREAEVLDLHYFFGLTPPEIADTLGISDRQVRRDFAHARVWLRHEIGV
jgi:RNA polymerase sigma factor (TIGR02999 family)